VVLEILSVGVCGWFLLGLGLGGFGFVFCLGFSLSCFVFLTKV